MNLLSDCIKQVDLFRQCLNRPGSRLFCGTDFKEFIATGVSKEQERALLCHSQPLTLAASKPRLLHVHRQLSDNTRQTDRQTVAGLWTSLATNETGSETATVVSCSDVAVSRI